MITWNVKQADMDITKKPVIGKVIAKPITGVEGQTEFDIIDTYEQNGHTFYVTNQWYKEHNRIPLVIVDVMVESYTPISKQAMFLKVLNNEFEIIPVYNENLDIVGYEVELNGRKLFQIPTSKSLSKYEIEQEVAKLVPAYASKTKKIKTFEIANKIIEFGFWDLGDYELTLEDMENIEEAVGNGEIEGELTSQQADRRQSPQGDFHDFWWEVVSSVKKADKGTTWEDIFEKFVVGDYLMNERGQQGKVIYLDANSMKIKWYDGLSEMYNSEEASKLHLTPIPMSAVRKPISSKKQAKNEYQLRDFDFEIEAEDGVDYYSVTVNFSSKHITAEDYSYDKITVDSLDDETKFNDKNEKMESFEPNKTEYNAMMDRVEHIMDEDALIYLSQVRGSKTMFWSKFMLDAKVKGFKHPLKKKKSSIEKQAQALHDKVFEALDQLDGKDLINSLYKVRNMFNLDEKEMAALYEEWKTPAKPIEVKQEEKPAETNAALKLEKIDEYKQYILDEYEKKWGYDSNQKHYTSDDVGDDGRIYGPGSEYVQVGKSYDEWIQAEKGSKQAKYKFLETPGHGYLIVPIAEVIDAAKNGVDITPYSSVVGDKVYLEEDLDAGMFMDHKGINYKTDVVTEYGEFNHGDYPSFETSKYLKKGSDDGRKAYDEWIQAEKGSKKATQEINGGFAINTSDEFTIVENAKEKGIELTDEVWNIINKDIHQIELNCMAYLKELGFTVSDEGHNSSEELIGSFWSPISNKEFIEKYTDEPMSTGSGTLDYDVFKGVSGTGEDLIDASISFFAVEEVKESSLGKKADTKSFIYTVWTYDVWGNDEEGYEVNDRSKLTTIEFDKEPSNEEIVKELQDREYLKKSVNIDELDIDGDDVEITIDLKKNGYPLFGLERQSSLNKTSERFTYKVRKCVTQNGWDWDIYDTEKNEIVESNAVGVHTEEAAEDEAKAETAYLNKQYGKELPWKERMEMRKEITMGEPFVGPGKHWGKKAEYLPSGFYEKIKKWIALGDTDEKIISKIKVMFDVCDDAAKMYLDEAKGKKGSKGESGWRPYSAGGVDRIEILMDGKIIATYLSSLVFNSEAFKVRFGQEVYDKAIKQLNDSGGRLDRDASLPKEDQEGFNKWFKENDTNYKEDYDDYVGEMRSDGKKTDTFKSWMEMFYLDNIKGKQASIDKKAVKRVELKDKKTGKVVDHFLVENSVNDSVLKETYGEYDVSIIPQKGMGSDYIYEPGIVSKNNTKVFSGTYNEYGYTILKNDESVYSAGNNKLESDPAQSLPLLSPNALPVEKIKEFCEQTGKEMADEEKGSWSGCEYDKRDVGSSLQKATKKSFIADFQYPDGTIGKIEFESEIEAKECLESLSKEAKVAYDKPEDYWYIDVNDAGDMFALGYSSESIMKIDRTLHSSEKLQAKYEEIFDIADDKQLEKFLDEILKYSVGSLDSIKKFVEAKKITQFWVVTYPTKNSTIQDILFKADMARMELQFHGGLKAEDIVGVYDDEDEADSVAHDLIIAPESSLKKQAQKLTQEQAAWLLHWAGWSVYSGPYDMKEFAEMENEESLYKSLPESVKKNQEEGIDWGIAESVANSGVETGYEILEGTNYQSGGREYLLIPSDANKQLAKAVLAFYRLNADKDDYVLLSGWDKEDVEKIFKDDDQEAMEALDEDVQITVDHLMKDNKWQLIYPYDRMGSHLGEWFGYNVFQDDEGRSYIV